MADHQQLVAEAIQRNAALEAIAEEGLQAYNSAGAIAKMVVRDQVRRGIGMSLEDLRREVHETTLLLRGVHSGDVALADARPLLELHARLVKRTVEFVESIQHMANRVKDPSQRDRILAVGEARVADARRLAVILDILTGHGA